MPEFIILTAAVAGPILLSQRIRSRTKLIYVGFCGGGLAFLTTLGIGVLAGQVFGAAQITHFSPAEGVDLLTRADFASRLFSGAAWHGICVVLAGFLMTGLLPFVERLFDVQTDISLLELGDAAHPLLQQLARRAPGTYNHSINVASLGEVAAEAVGGNGLLVRVGAYFHDIGKMLNPNYFIENKGQEPNQHDSLLPSMSTLVIVRHVKDGVDLARQHRIPQAIIDFIEQHHGTTLVEYFYRLAERQTSEESNGGKVDENHFRYPGPKPQTKETCVLMLADAAESASRTLVEPTPSRIESLVHDIAMKKLLDGQFDECGLTLQELHRIEDSLVKSLAAVYHGRIKYPDQQTS
jgi:putative nucleotidyltransferase with HDIG domain